MRFIRGLQNLPRDWRGCALTIGNFDGMHRGHQALIARTRAWADKLGVPLAVMCFESTPREYLTRSEEHTSELQSLMRIPYAVFCLQKKRPQASETTQNTNGTEEIHAHITKTHNIQTHTLDTKTTM